MSSKTTSRKLSENTLLERYRRLSAPAGFLAAAAIAWLLATSVGIAAGLGAMYAYDRANGNAGNLSAVGNEAAFLFGGMYGAGTLVLVITFTWLRSLRDEVTGRTPVLALIFCLAGAAVTTALVANKDYAGFIATDWLAIVICGLVSLLVSWKFVKAEYSR